MSAHPENRTEQPGDHLWHWLPYLLALPALGVASLIIYAVSQHHARAFAVGFAVAAAALLVGALLGFIFAIPRSLTAADAPPRPDEKRLFRSNSNLEQISDWLTKILVGIGLVEFRTIVDNARDLIKFLQPGFGSSEATHSFVLGVLMLFTVSGFLIAYLVTRLYFAPEFARAEEALVNRLSNITDQLRVADARLADRLSVVDARLVAATERLVQLAEEPPAREAPQPPEPPPGGSGNGF